MSILVKTLFLRKLVELGGKVFEEIMVENDWDTSEQLRVDGAAVENVIDIYPMAVELFCKPGDGTSFWLSVNDILDSLADMHIKF